MIDVLFIYNKPDSLDASTIDEHIKSFNKILSSETIKLNTFYGFPRSLNRINFQVIILHYSLFGNYPFQLSKKHVRFLKKSSNSIKVAFFQDEYQFCQERFRFIDEINLTAIFTLFEEDNHHIYLNNTDCKFVFKTLTGYVSDDLINSLEELDAINYNDRKIDIFYRARQLPFYIGKGALEKYQLALEVEKYSKSGKLNIDISLNEHDRLYGRDWILKLMSSKATLGSMSGTSIVDIDGEISKKIKSISRFKTQKKVKNLKKTVDKLEGNFNYRAISPRIFEAACTKTLMILHEDDYQGIIQANIHYVPIYKDYSNLDQAMNVIQDSDTVSTIIENAFQDLIKSENYNYNSFTKDFEEKIKYLIKFSGLCYLEKQQNFNLFKNIFEKDVRKKIANKQFNIRLYNNIRRNKILFKVSKFIYKIISGFLKLIGIR